MAKKIEQTLKSVEPEPVPKTADSIEADSALNTETATVESSRSTKSTDDAGAGPIAGKLAASKETGIDETPPARPPRPPVERRLSSFSAHLEELKQAFPDADAGLRRAVLVAASDDLEAAFTGMLALNDATIRPAAYVKQQIANDEQLARNLVQTDQSRERGRAQQAPQRRRYADESAYERRPSQDADADEIYDSMSRGYNDTKQAVSSIWDSLKQRWNGELRDDEPEQMFRRRSGAGNFSGQNREPLHTQWWPRQDGPETQAGGSLFNEECDAQPRLPPRKPSQPFAYPFEPRSVNAFGDNISKAGKPDEPEPDAFFIGESDDDLGSLNEQAGEFRDVIGDENDLNDEMKDLKLDAKDGKDGKRDLTSEKKNVNDDKKDISEEKNEKKDDKEAEEEKAEASKERKNSAKDLLNKVKSESK